MTCYNIWWRKILDAGRIKGQSLAPRCRRCRTFGSLLLCFDLPKQSGPRGIGPVSLQIMQITMKLWNKHPILSKVFCHSYSMALQTSEYPESWLQQDNNQVNRTFSLCTRYLTAFNLGFRLPSGSGRTRTREGFSTSWACELDEVGLLHLWHLRCVSNEWSRVTSGLVHRKSMKIQH